MTGARNGDGNNVTVHPGKKESQDERRRGDRGAARRAECCRSNRSGRATCFRVDNTVARRAVLVAFLVALLCSPGDAQIPQRMKQCVVAPTLTEEIFGVLREVNYPRIAIAEAELVGDYALPEAVRAEALGRLRGQSFGPGWGISDGKVDDAVSIEIRGAWQDHGYFNAEVHTEMRVIHEDYRQRHVALKLRVDEGRQYRLARIDIANATVFPAEKLRAMIPLKDGEVVDVSKIRKGLDVIRMAYGEEGYIDFTPQPNVVTDNDRGELFLHLFMDEQRKYWVEVLELVGLDEAARKKVNWTLKPGDIFRLSSLDEFLRANKTIFPEDASPLDAQVYRNLATGKVKIVFDLRTCQSYSWMNASALRGFDGEFQADGLGDGDQGGQARVAVGG